MDLSNVEIPFSHGVWDADGARRALGMKACPAAYAGPIVM